MDFISAQFFLICAKWKQAFVEDEIKFYFRIIGADDTTCEKEIVNASDEEIG